MTDTTKPKGAKSPCWTGYGRVSGNYLSEIRRNSRRHNRGRINISAKYLWWLFRKQKGKCALTGQDLTLPESSSRENLKLSTASIDRIDSSKGYLKGNLQWVHKRINKMKMDLDQDYFIELCRKVTKHSEKTTT